MVFSLLKNWLKKESHFCTGHSIQGRKAAQEDSFFISEPVRNQQLVLVADGVGGHGHGDFASQLVIEIFKNEFSNQSPVADAASFLRKTALLAAATLLNEIAKNEAYKKCGTTLTGFLITDNQYITINIGDSRVYLYDGFTLNRLTKDHSEVQRLLDLGFINEEEAFTHPQGNIMNSAIGQEIDKMTIDIEELNTLKDQELLLVCSDGVHDALRTNEILALIEKHKDNPDLAQILVSAAYEAGGKDNITACVYRK